MGVLELCGLAKGFPGQTPIMPRASFATCQEAPFCYQWYRSIHWEMQLISNLQSKLLFVAKLPRVRRGYNSHPFLDAC